MRGRTKNWLAVGVASVFALTGCAITPPTPPVAGPSQTAQPMTPSASATTSEPSPAATTPSASPVVLAGTGLAGHPFGDAEATVLTTLNAALGGAEDSHQGLLCELDSGSPWSQTVNYGGLAVLFVAPSKSKTAPRSLKAWSLRLDQPVDPALAIADNVPLDLSFKQLKAKYPAAKLEDTGLGDDSQILTLPNKLRFLGIETPDLVQAGALLFCE
ncbi:MAG: hypothetical protein WCF12_13640 [Propionicimonas sp.]